MAIIRTTTEQSTNVVTAQTIHFLGRVVRTEVVTETRNWSDTMDYTDYRSTKCIYALVYMGRHGIAPMTRAGRTVAGVNPYPGSELRDLEVGERFAWIDCTNLFSWRGVPVLTAVVDTFDMQLLHGGPEMFDDLVAWDAHQVVLQKAAAEEREAAAKAAEAQRQATIAKAEKKAAKEAQLKASAEALLARIPVKGTTVTVDGFTGKVFWTGVSKYRGAYNARAGVKDSKGEVTWIDAAKF
jgi:hypothetical protein